MHGIPGAFQLAKSTAATRIHAENSQMVIVKVHPTEEDCARIHNSNSVATAQEVIGVLIHALALQMMIASDAPLRLACVEATRPALCHLASHPS